MPATPKVTLEKMLELMGFTVTVDERPFDDGLLLDIKTDDPGRLIGRQGRTLSDLQYVLSRLCHTQDPASPKLTVDVGGYRTAAHDAIVKLALETAERVRRGGDIMELEPMNSYERRLVHQALREDPDIETQSVEVEGTDKKAILLRPKRH
jgi:spoIIIJ-associated protein